MPDGLQGGCTFLWESCGVLPEAGVPDCFAELLTGNRESTRSASKIALKVCVYSLFPSVGADQVSALELQPDYVKVLMRRAISSEETEKYHDAMEG